MARGAPEALLTKKVLPPSASVPCAMKRAGWVPSLGPVGVKVKFMDLPDRSSVPAGSVITAAAEDPRVVPAPLPPKPLVVGLNELGPINVRSRIAPAAMLAFAPVPRALGLPI